jgi:hypothetical protein
MSIILISLYLSVSEELVLRTHEATYNPREKDGKVPIHPPATYVKHQ